MKNIILSLFVLLTLNVTAKDTTSPKTADTAKFNWNSVYKDAKEGVKAIASGLKVGAEKVWIVLTKQQIVKAITNIVIYIFLFILFISFFNMSKARYKVCKVRMKEHSGSYRSFEEYIEGVGCIIFGVLSGISGIVLVVCFSATIDVTVTGIVNPEYGAIRDVMEFVKGQK